MKAREQREKVMIKARMRSGADWHDICILNLSTHGVGIQAATPPERGAYVEIRRGPNVIIARVAWIKGHRAGLRSQDPIFIPAIVKEMPAVAGAGSTTSAPPYERRRHQRLPQRHEESRLKGRAMEFAGFALAALLMAMTLFGAVEEGLAKPLSEISSALGGAQAPLVSSP